MSLSERIAKQRQKLAAAKRRLRTEGGTQSVHGAHSAATQKFNGGTFNSGFAYDYDTQDAAPSPASFVSAKVRASGVIRTPEARHSDFRRSQFHHPSHDSNSTTSAYFTSRSRETSPLPRALSPPPPPPTPNANSADPSSPYRKKLGHLHTRPQHLQETPEDSDRIARQLRQQRVAAHLNLSDPEPNDLHTVLDLREQLTLKRNELKAAKEELNFSGEIMDMLRADVAKSDAENNSRLIVVTEAAEMKLRSAAEVDVLNEQISTRDRIVCDLKENLIQSCSERDAKEQHLRELREKYDLSWVVFVLLA